MAARVADAGQWRAWARQVEHAGHCMRPVRVRGGAAAVDVRTGEVLAEYGTEGQPDGALLLACKDRRAAVCPACAETYRRDTWHVIAAGLRGRTPSTPPGEAGGGQAGGRGRLGDGVPGSVAGHPVVLATLTAPSFGAVHRVSEDGPCRARSGRPECQHGLPLWCNARHGTTDSVKDRRVGWPLCWDCYDYTGHVLWHGAVPELWRRTTIYLYRALARIGSARIGRRVSVRAVRDVVRVSYVKVAEFQKRAAVHLHAIIRLDGVDPDDPDRVVRPPGWADVVALEAALRDAARRVAVPLPEMGWRARTARWGGQLDVTAVNDARRAAAYLAKYATKTAGDTLSGLPPRRFTRRDLERLRRRGASSHVMLLVEACLTLAARADCAGFRFGDYPHTLGFRGHFATKSRRYSITLTALRAARRAWRSRTHPAGQGRPGKDRDPWAAGHGDDGTTVIVKEWRYLGTGWARPGDADLAATLARDHAAAREAADIATTYRAGDPR